jgi:hypothetical protein
MSQQSLLFQSHSPTSKAAAEAFASRAPDARRRVYDAIQATKYFGLTDEQIQDTIRMGANTQRPRRIELQRAGLIEDSGRTRACHSGQHAVVWICTDAPYPSRWPSKEKKP